MKKIYVTLVVVISVVLLCLLLPSRRTNAQLSFPVILSAVFDAPNGKLKIDGSNFGASPKVNLGTASLTTETSSATEIVTTLPASFLPGSYVLKAQFASGIPAFFVLNIGSTTVPPVTGCGTNPPVIVALSPAPQTGAVGQPVVIGITATDADAVACNGKDFLTASSQFVGLPPLSKLQALTPPVGFNPSFIPDVPGAYTVLVTVTDSTGRTDHGSVTINAF